MSSVRKILLRVLGGAFIVTGAAGLFLPFLQGVLLIAVGVYILMVSSERLRERVHALAERSPRLRRALDAAERFARRVFPH